MAQEGQCARPVVRQADGHLRPLHAFPAQVVFRSRAPLDQRTVIAGKPADLVGRDRMHGAGGLGRAVAQAQGD